MQIQFEAQPFSSVSADAIVTYVFDKDSRVEGAVTELDRATGGRIKSLSDSGELTGKSLEMTLLHFPAGIAAQRLLLIGAGKPEKFSNASLRHISGARSEEHTSELQSHVNLVCRLLLEKKKKQ